MARLLLLTGWLLLLAQPAVLDSPGTTHSQLAFPTPAVNHEDARRGLSTDQPGGNLFSMVSPSPQMARTRVKLTRHRDSCTWNVTQCDVLSRLTGQLPVQRYLLITCCECIWWLE